MPDLVERHPKHPGSRVIAAILEAGAIVTRSDLEELFLDDFLPRDGLPWPKVNEWLRAGSESFECDFVWLRDRLIVELDGRAFHGTPAAFDRDRARDRRLVAAGWRVIRVTWRQLHAEPDALAADLWAALGAR